MAEIKHNSDRKHGNRAHKIPKMANNKGQIVMVSIQNWNTKDTGRPIMQDVGHLDNVFQPDDRW